MRELNFNSGVGGVKTLSYTYDANGNIKTVKEGSSEVASYEYDGLNRLTRENIAGEKTVVYTYDAGGNLKTKKEYAYTKSATLGTVKDTFNYTYASGTWGDRLTKYDVGSIQYNEAGYPTMYRGHVLSWEKGNLQYFDNTDFIYNDSGIRIAKGSTDYFVKGNQILAEKRGSTVIHYYYDENGVAGFEYAGQQYYYRKNLQGDIIGIYDSCGNLLGEYKYDAWGNILSQGGSNILTINPFRYRGYYYDEETGLYYLNSRYYDPETGRFISPDDVGVLDETFTQLNGLNLYAYCYNNPVGYTDIFGHIPVANAFYKIYQSTLIFGFDSKWWGRINYSVSVPIKQTEEAGIFYSFSALRRTDNVIEGGAGINLWGWFGIEVGYNSGGNLYFSMNVTPWLSSGVSFGADGLTCTLGFNDGKVTHEVNFGIGWGLVILVGGVAAVVLSGGQLLSPVLQFFQKLFA